MKKNTVVIENNRITIIGSKSNIAALIFLWFLATSCFLIPLAVTISQIVLGNGFRFGMLILFLIFWGLSALMTRIVLWNTYGKEILQLHEKTIEYIADYKFFKDGNKTFQVSEIQFGTAEFIELRNKKMWTLRIKSNNEIFQTSLKLDLDEIELINKELKTRYNSAYILLGVESLILK
jgi:hypothetical protein